MSQFGKAVLTALSQTAYQGARSTYIEQSTCFVTASYLDIDGVAFVPAAVSYKIDDELSGKNIVPLTPIVPALLNMVTVSSLQNAMISFTRAYEVHAMTFQITDGGGDVNAAIVKFDILRVVGLP